MEDAFFHLQEARIHLEGILRSQEALESDNEAYLLVLLGHVQEHLNLAWARVAGEGDLKQIPNWTMDFQLVCPRVKNE